MISSATVIQLSCKESALSLLGALYRNIIFSSLCQMALGSGPHFWAKEGCLLYVCYLSPALSLSLSRTDRTHKKADKLSHAQLAK